MTQRSSFTKETATTPSDQNTPGAAMRDVVDQAKETAGQVADQTQQAARRVVDQAREQVSSKLGTQKDNAAAGLTSVAQALRQTGQTLREQDQTGVTSYIDSAASQVEHLSSYLQERDISQLVDDVEHFARRRPALFVGGALVLGILGARFLKSSRQQVDRSSEYPIVRREMYPQSKGIYTQNYNPAPMPQTTRYGTWPTTGSEEEL